ncbi:hypothetical protein LMJF_13_1410 [Leishmania major strain Friedlin]|uniref:Uncharacterized protein n=1 Tax=Leishmania major TaxID=5664 RepID=Q4QG13_LEIMA|nr:hypothetical protein LMJF_13_1410 [Leishmania major strain Friedlin]CAG9571139.1 hypothetical_protein_-_conserved [Leishmania major strain Friedlin]CAJ03139.1 hypothetical protein LMJF_13_1410 [Leishmania major strain Friedlin]|eukprot:XP_001681885.1 hypothetical protein LMJF_13_1410 [Leishmania major strain Friedlin]
MQRQSSTKSGCRNASELSPVRSSAYEMRNRESPPPMRSGSPLSPSAIFVKRAVSNGRPHALSGRTNHGGDEEQKNDEGKKRGSSGSARTTSRGSATGSTPAIATTCAALLVSDVPDPSSLAPSSVPPLSHSSISEISSAHNPRSVSPGDSSSRQVTGMHKSLLVFLPRVFRATGMPPPSATTPVSASDALVTPLSSPTAVAATSPMSPEGVALPNQLTYFSIGGSRRRNSISVPTSPFQVEGDRAEDSFMEDIVGGAGERWLVDTHHRAVPDRNSHAGARLERPTASGNVTATVADSVDRTTTRSSRNAHHASEDDGTASHANSAASTRSSSSPPSSPSHTARSSAASRSSAAGVAASAASAASTPVPTSHNVPAPPPISTAPQGSRSAVNAGNRSLSTDHAHHSLIIAPPPSPLVSPVAISVAGGRAGETTSPANRGGAALSRCDSQSPSPSLRFGTHDPYNTSAIVATPLMSGVPRTTSFTSYRSPSATTTPIGPGIVHMRMRNTSALANGSAGGGSGGNAADSGASFLYCAVANSDTMSVKSSMTGVSRGTHDGIMLWAATGGPSKLPSSSTWEYFLHDPQGPYGGCAAPQTARYAHEEAPASTPTPSCAVGDNAVDASSEAADQQYGSEQTPSEQPYDPQHDYSLQQHSVQRHQVQRADRYAPSYEQRQQQHPHPHPVHEITGQCQPFEPQQQCDHERHEQAYQSGYPHLRPEQQHQHKAHNYPQQHVNSQQQEQHHRHPYSPAFEPHGLYAYQAYAGQPQQYPPPQGPYSYASQPPPAHVHAPRPQQQHDHQRQQPPQQAYHTQHSYGGRGGNAGAAAHNWSGPRKRVAQDVLPGFFSVDAIQLGDQTHLVSDRNGVPHEPNEQQQQLCHEELHDVPPLARGSGVDHTPPHRETCHQSCGPAAAPDFDNRGSSLAPTAIPSAPVVQQQQEQQLGRSSSVYYDTTPALSAPGDYSSGSRAGAEFTTAAPSTFPYGSDDDDDEAMRIHGGGMYGSQPRHAEQHEGSASVMTVGGMMVAQPPHMAAPVVSRTPNQRTGYAVNNRGGSSSGPSNKSILLNSNVSGGVNSVEANESGSFRSANSGGGADIAHVYNVDNSIDICGGPGALTPTLLGAGPNVPVGVRCSDGDIGASATPTRAVYGGYLHHPSAKNYAMGYTDMYVSQPERRTTGSAAATSSSQDGANESRSTSNVLFAPPLPRSAGAMDGGAATHHQPSHSRAPSLQESPITRQCQQRHPTLSSSAADELQPMKSRDDYLPHISSPSRRRSSIPSVNQPSKYGDMRSPQQQQFQVLSHVPPQLRNPSEGSNSSSNNTGYAQASAVRSTGAMSGTTAQGVSLSGASLLNHDTGKAAAALSPYPYDARPTKPEREAWERAEFGRVDPGVVPSSIQTFGTSTPTTQQRQHPQKQ